MQISTQASLGLDSMGICALFSIFAASQTFFFSKVSQYFLEGSNCSEAMQELKCPSTSLLLGLCRFLPCVTQSTIISQHLLQALWFSAEETEPQRHWSISPKLPSWEGMGLQAGPLEPYALQNPGQSCFAVVLACHMLWGKNLPGEKGGAVA